MDTNRYLSKPCELCDGTGIVKGSIDLGGMLPDIQCGKCLGTGKDFTPELERRRRAIEPRNKGD